MVIICANSEPNTERIGIDFDFIFALVFVTVSGAERGWDSSFLQDVILPFFERGLLLFKIQFLVSEGQNRGENQSSHVVWIGVGFAKIQAAISLLKWTRNLRQTSVALQLEVGLKTPADRAAKCWATWDSIHSSFKKHVAAEFSRYLC